MTVTKFFVFAVTSVSGFLLCTTGQSLNPANLPPLCDCSAVSQIQQNVAQRMNPMFFRNGQGGQGGFSNNFGGGGGGGYGSNFQGRVPEWVMPICGNDGQNYTNHCLLENAKANNPNLGARPCDSNPPPLPPPEMMNGPMNGMGRSWMKVVCLVSGQAINDTMPNINQYLQKNPNDGIRCEGGCPCSLVCPEVGRLGPGY